MTRYIAAYDTESPRCIKGVREIVRVHRKYSMPATFFITGTTAEGNPGEYRDLLDDPLFEVASHTYSHKMLRDNPFCGPAQPPEGIREQILRGTEVVEKVFRRDCLGLRPGCSFEFGLKGAPEVLAVVQETGLKYVSSMAWGKDYSLPAPLNQPFRYDEDGYPEIWEIPCHGWHENLLKNHNKWGPRRITLWPPEMPDAIPPDFLKTPEEEFAVNKVFLDKAKRDELAFVSLIWHPWSLYAFDPEMRMLELTFAYVQSMGLKTTTYAEFCGELNAAK
ncbi:MAG TPA: polysaccharide deacetylase family protein [Candidatus Latescibacteria bacterium]|nr:polysaccharide deacetylase family protein [Candidatus Latescibacterota bacterium]